MGLSREVAALMRGVAQEVVLSRYRLLGAADIAEKSPGEIVTAVDREAELRLREGLVRLEGDARIVGEEACADDPRLLDGIGRGLVWLIDPLDGTANFARGEGAFGMMIALVADGEPVASWMLDPLSGRMCHAERGLGAWIDDRPARIAPRDERDDARFARRGHGAHPSAVSSGDEVELDCGERVVMSRRARETHARCKPMA